MNGYTGKILEEEILGSCTVSTEGYLRFREAMEVARRSQPRTLTHEGRQLRDGVAQELGVRSSEVAMYPGVGTPLDRFHGIDGWFEWQGIVVTVDVTMNPHKDEYKARVIVSGRDAEEGFVGSIRDIASEFKRAKSYGWIGVI